MHNESDDGRLLRALHLLQTNSRSTLYGVLLRAITCSITTGRTMSKATTSAFSEGAMKINPLTAHNMREPARIGTNQCPTTAADKAMTPTIQLVAV